MGIFSDNLIIILGLMIPFAGILFPILVLLLFQVSHPEAPAAEAASPEDALDRATRPVSAPIPGGESRSRRQAADPDRLRRTHVVQGPSPGVGCL